MMAAPRHPIPPEPAGAQTPSARAATALAIAAALLLAAPAAGQGEAEWVEGSGSWGPGEAKESANATWLLVDGEMTVYHVTTPGGVQAHCNAGNGTLTTADGRGLTGRCSSERAADATRLVFQPETNGEPENGTGPLAYDGRFEAHSVTPVGAPAGASTLLGGLLVLLAAAFAVTTLALTLLFVRERRLTGHLARRLWEKSRGKSAKRGDPLQQENVKRILVRSKN